ncbi:STN domain-containing protein [Bradyrhizobium sp. WSM1743]|uniref:STN domain-containing protein n=1 Tax=Bradyrhizobium sp. WSM1743 TaxID=318996 RepID=UPI0012EBB4E6|nr:STN domain-containing protein [Bradyrhizobium sp. WSM1743]
MSRRVPYLAVCLMFAAVAAEAEPSGAIIGSTRANSEMSVPMSFDIPAQPLASALDRYGDATGREVLYNPALAQGRSSEAVKGSFEPEVALQLLLAGTGLAARFLKDNSFVLVPAPVAPGPPEGSAAALTRQYYGVVQARLRDALCRPTRRGREAIASRLWFGSRHRGP